MKALSMALQKGRGKTNQYICSEYAWNKNMWFVRKKRVGVERTMLLQKIESLVAPDRNG
ncbi:hypothetical protein ccbrp13_69560 [Ktedonobacteria bacterium brp13]|nr:hypothetical protein ccbrp13_69560 [Ktedonobacteria bacterium brp13]